MAVLEVVRASWLSGDFEVFADGARVGFVDSARGREAAKLTANGTTCRARRRKSGFVLEQEGMLVASAARVSLWRGSYHVQWEGRTYELARASVWGRAYALRGDSAAGTIRPQGWASRKLVADLPDDLPLPVRLFVVWIVLTLWKRAAQSAA